MGVAPSWYCPALKLSVSKKLRSRAFCWCIVCFCTSNGSFIILKKAEEFFFEIRLFPQFLKMTKIQNIFSPAFFNILKELYVVQKQTIHQQKALDLSFNLKPWKWAWHHQEGATPSRRESIFYCGLFTKSGGPLQSIQFFRYVEIVIKRIYVYLNWMFYIKSPYLRISKISSFLS